MDDTIFAKALSTYQPENCLIACRPNGFSTTNTRSEATQLSLQNIEAPPFQISVWESSEAPDKLFQLQPHPPTVQRELTAMIVGQSEQHRIIAFHISNTGVCSFFYVHTYAGMKEDDNIKVHQLQLSDIVKHFKLRIDCGPSLAYLLEHDLFKTAGYSRNFVRYIKVTEIINGQKTRRFEHSHIDSMPVNSNWHLTNYTPIL